MCVITDPLGQNHSPVSGDHYSHLIELRGFKVGTDGRTDTSCENNDHNQP